MACLLKRSISAVSNLNFDVRILVRGRCVVIVSKKHFCLLKVACLHGFKKYSYAMYQPKLFLPFSC